jgi:hypothetical protein
MTMLNATSQAVPDFSRLGLRAYSQSQMVDLAYPGGSFLATLITLSNYGARLKAPGALLGLALGDHAQFNLVVPEKGLQAGRIPCRITWVEEGEVEVAFAHLLDMTMGEVQAAVDC